MNLLPKFFRRKIAFLLAWTSPEYGGMVMDYGNGNMDKIFEWTNDKEVTEAMAVVDAMVDGGRDAIYIVVVKCGVGKGYFALERTGRAIPWVRAFWVGIYSFEDAFVDTMKQARKYADQMGFRKPEDTTGRAS